MASYDSIITILFVVSLISFGGAIAAMTLSILLYDRVFHGKHEEENHELYATVDDETKKLVDTLTPPDENDGTEGADLEDTLNEVEQRIWGRDNDAYFALYGKNRKLTPHLRAQLRKRALQPKTRED